MTEASERVELSTFNGFKVEVVAAGTELRDVQGKKSPVVIDDRTIGIAGHRLYATETVWDRLKAGTKDKHGDVKAEDSTIDADGAKSSKIHKAAARKPAKGKSEA